jgi:hypothetical protein
MADASLVIYSLCGIAPTPQPQDRERPIVEQSRDESTLETEPLAAAKGECGA